MEKIEKYKKYIGKYIRNKYGIAKIVDVLEGKGEVALKLDNKIVFMVNSKTGEIDNRYLGDVYPITEFTNKLDERIKDITELIEDEDFVVLEYKSPKYRERIARRFEVSIIDDTINFENAHCDFRCKIGDKKIKDEICKNIKIKEILTHEQYKQNCYKVEE